MPLAFTAGGLSCSTCSHESFHLTFAVFLVLRDLINKSLIRKCNIYELEKLSTGDLIVAFVSRSLFHNDYVGSPTSAFPLFQMLCSMAFFTLRVF